MTEGKTILDAIVVNDGDRESRIIIKAFFSDDKKESSYLCFNKIGNFNLSNLIGKNIDEIVEDFGTDLIFHVYNSNCGN